jgi:hypothetical protein
MSLVPSTHYVVAVTTSYETSSLRYFLINFGVIPLSLGASSGFSGCTCFPTSSSCWPCPSYGASMSMPTGFFCWVSSIMGVGLPSVISGDEISSTLTTYGG